MDVETHRRPDRDAARQAGAGPAGGDRPAGPPIAFGPVRSRRVGWSLGINNVPPKTCTYACLYCQVGATDRARLEREDFQEPAALVAAVRELLDRCRASGQPVDHLTFVPNGEPTLDRRLGAEIRDLTPLRVPIAVLTNGSLLWRSDVRRDLDAADLVSVKVDTVDEATWRRLDRPVGRLELATVLDGMRHFARSFRGRLITETMLIADVNDDAASIGPTAAFVHSLGPSHAYLAIPARPPAEPWVRAPTADVIRAAAERFRAAGLPTSCLVEEIDPAERPFATVGDGVASLLGIVAVHPMTVGAAREHLARTGSDPSRIDELLRSGRLVEVRRGSTTYLRRGRIERAPRG